MELKQDIESRHEWKPTKKTHQHNTLLSYYCASCFSSHEPSSGTAYYNSLKKHKYILACTGSLSEISLNFGYLKVINRYIVFIGLNHWVHLGREK
jgi:hypothetical protein